MKTVRLLSLLMGPYNTKVVGHNPLLLMEISHMQNWFQKCGELNIDPNLIKLEFTVKFDPSCLLPLHDETAVVKMFRFNDMFCHVYVFPHIEVGEGLIAQTRYIWP